MTATSLHLDPRYIWIAALPVGVLLGSEFLTIALGAYPIEFGDKAFKSSLAAPDVATEASQRFRMLGLFALNLFVSIGIIARMQADRTLFSEATQRVLLIATIVLSLLGIAVLVSALNQWGVIRTFDLIGRDAVSKAAELLASSEANPLTERTLRYWVNLSGALATIATAFLVLGAISCLAKPASKNPEDLEALKTHWRFQTERLQFILYVSTALLIVGTLFIESWVRWPEFAFLSTEGADDKKTTAAALAAFRSLAGNCVLFTGIVYTILLASFALPVGFIMSKQADAIAEKTIGARNKAIGKADQTTTDAERSEEKTDQKLTLSLTDIVKAVIAILAPLIAGTLGSLTTLLAK